MSIRPSTIARRLTVLVCILALTVTGVAFGQQSGSSRGVEKLASRLSPSVVGIRVVESWVESGDGSGLAQSSTLLSVSGLVLNRSGEVLTLFRDGLPSGQRGGEVRLEATLSNGEVFLAEWQSTDRSSGLTLVRILEAPKKQLRAVKWAQSNKVEPGSFVLSVGCSYGMPHSYQMGLVSGPNRRMRHRAFPRLLRVSLNAEPGDVGGLLANDRGECLGMLALAFSAGQGSLPERSGPVYGNRSVSAAGKGTVFAIPSDTLTRIATQLRKGGVVDRGALGADFYFINRAEAKQCTHRQHGVSVLELDPHGTALLAGFQRGDLIARVNNRDMRTEADFYWFAELVQYGKVGEQLRVEVHRYDEEGIHSVHLLKPKIGSLAALREARRSPQRSN